MGKRKAKQPKLIHVPWYRFRASSGWWMAGHPWETLINAEREVERLKMQHGSMVEIEIRTYQEIAKEKRTS